MDTPIKTIAIEFLRMAAAGQVREAFRLHVADSFRHHNPYFGGDREALLEAMEQSSAAEPNKTFEVHQAIADAETVAVHSHLKRAATRHEYAVVHILKFEDGKIIEMWDVAQEIPSEPANECGMF